MKTFTIATFVAMASVATAQFENIPSCALSCFVGPLTSDGCSSLTDFACHCKKGAELLSQVQPCVEGACSASDQAVTTSAVESTCAAAGAPITIPDASAPAVSSAVASATSAAASAASSVESSIASEVSSILSKASSVVASAASSASASRSASISVTATPTGNASQSATPSASSSEFTGAAAQATQAVGILGAAALAMLAL